MAIEEKNPKFDVARNYRSCDCGEVGPHSHFLAMHVHETKCMLCGYEYLSHLTQKRFCPIPKTEKKV